MPPRPHALFSSAALWAFLAAATGSGLAAVEPLGRPWLLLCPDGGGEIGCRIPATATVAPELIHLEQAGKTLPLAPEPVPGAPPADEPARREPERPGQVVRFTVPAATLRNGPLTLHLDQVSLPLAIRPPPPATSTAPVRLVMAGAADWPDRTALERMATVLGGPVDAVLTTGERLEQVLGDGGWEDSTPVLILGAGEAPPAASLAHASARWPTGCTWGLVGLPAGNDAEGLRAALARDLSPWLVPVALGHPWDPMLGRERGSLADLLPWLVPCRQFRVPVLLLTGSAAGWISEPLAPAKGRLAAQAGGTRVLSATPAGGALGSQPDLMALALTHPALLGLKATPDHLTVTFVPTASDQPPLSLDYPLPPAAGQPPRPASGWGDDTCEAARLAALGARDTPEQQAAADAGLARLSWLPSPVLGNLHLSDDEFIRLGEKMDQPATLLLLRRMACCDALIRDHLAPLGERLPLGVRHDLVLRHAAKPLTVDEAVWAPAITTGNDPDLLRAAITACARNLDPTLAHLLLERLRQQAAGTLPLEHDPLLQHQMLCVVFESPHLSPTPLRQIALALRPKVDPLCRGPIERFLARVGETRPTP